MACFRSTAVGDPVPVLPLWAGFACWQHAFRKARKRVQVGETPPVLRKLHLWAVVTGRRCVGIVTQGISRLFTKSPGYAELGGFGLGGERRQLRRLLRRTRAAQLEVCRCPAVGVIISVSAHIWYQSFPTLTTADCTFPLLSSLESGRAAVREPHAEARTLCLPIRFV